VAQRSPQRLVDTHGATYSRSVVAVA
jgi:hypothetical protein